MHCNDGCDDDLLDVTRPSWRVDARRRRQGVLIGSPERADQLLALARVLLSADSLGALSATFAAPGRIPQGSHRLRCADREFPSGATPAG